MVLNQDYIVKYNLRNIHLNWNYNVHRVYYKEIIVTNAFKDIIINNKIVYYVVNCVRRVKMLVINVILVDIKE